jgi:lipopolysaccharide transport system permease protein
MARDLMYWGQLPSLGLLATYAVGALGFAVLGFAWFQKTRKGFADVL